MKRMIIGLVMALFVIVSCDVSDIDDGVVFSNKKVPATIKAEQVDEGGTKTIRNLDKSVSWMPSDEIAVFCGAEKAKFTSTNTENALTASFTGELSESLVHAINNGTNTNTIWGLYPYDENAVYDGTYITTTLPAQQTGIAGTFDDDLFISLAQSTNFSMYFYNVCSGFKFSVTKEGITSITLKGNNNEDIAGKVKLSFVDGKPKAEVVEGEKTITLVPEGSTFEVGKDYYFVILPTDFTQGFTVSLNTMSQTGNYAYAKSVDFPRSKFVNKANVDAGVEYGAKEGNIVIPDANFKAYLVQNFDKNKDGEIAYAEAEKILEINVDTESIKSLGGIEYCLNLETLICSCSNIGLSTGGLKSLDVSQNTSLTVLQCRNNQLSELIVSNNHALVELNCEMNNLTGLDVSDNTALKILKCTSNQLSGLDVSSNSALTELRCGFSQTAILDLSNNRALKQLQCYGVSSLDISNNVALTELICYGCQLTQLDLKYNIALKHVECYNNQLTDLNLHNLTKLEELICYNNPLRALDISRNLSLFRLICNDCQLTNLDVSLNTAMYDLVCDNNQLLTLDVSGNANLHRLVCTNNPSLTEIWLKTGQSIGYFLYDTSVATIKYID